MRPEDRARKHIDQSLEQAGWKVQDYRELDLTTSFGIAIREFPLGKDHADYMLFVDQKLVGVIEAKPFGTTLSGVAEQSQTYLSSISRLNSEWLPAFAYESTGIETFFRDLRDPDTRSRRLFSFHKPETLANWYADQDTLRKRLRTMSTEHPLNVDRLRDCQVQAIKNVERSFGDGRPRSLIQMATGSGKTFTAVSFIYRLIKFAGAIRILFLVDRSNLGRQTLKEFQQYVTPDDGRKFTELYNVQHLTSNSIDPVNKVVITTIQRLFLVETKFLRL